MACQLPAGWLTVRWKTGVCSFLEIFPFLIVFEVKETSNIHFMGVGILSVIWMLMKLSILARMVGSVLPALHQPLCCLTCCKCNKPKWIFSSRVCTGVMVWDFFPFRSSVRPPWELQVLIHSVWADLNKFKASPGMDKLRGEEEHGWQDGMH